MFVHHSLKESFCSFLASSIAPKKTKKSSPDLGQNMSHFLASKKPAEIQSNSGEKSYRIRMLSSMCFQIDFGMSSAGKFTMKRAADPSKI